jgi:hypothetical protein
MARSAEISPSGAYRWTLTRRWASALHPSLLVVMFNPSTADADHDDPTIATLILRAQRWCYGGFTVVNLIPKISPNPVDALRMVNTCEARGAWDERDALYRNREVIIVETERAAGVLLAYGALGDRCASWTETILDEIETAALNVPIYCLGRTSSGAPIHPLARGKQRLAPYAPLQHWRAAA